MKHISLRNPIFRIILLSLIILIFMIIPTKTAESHSLCVYYNIAKVICPGCGTTRAFSNFFHFNFKRAAEYNIVMTFTLIPIIVISLIIDIAYVIYNKLTNKQIISPVGYFVDMIIPKI